MFIIIFLAAFATVALADWVICALTHPIQAGQGILIFLCKAAGVIVLLSALCFWIGQGFTPVPGSSGSVPCPAATTRWSLQGRQTWPHGSRPIWVRRRSPPGSAPGAGIRGTASATLSPERSGDRCRSCSCSRSPRSGS
jgi:hypothetical protein